MYIIYSSAGLLAGKINNIAILAKVNSIGAREITFGSFDGGDNGEHNGIRLVQISIMMFFYGTIVFNRICKN